MGHSEMKGSGLRTLLVGVGTALWWSTALLWRILRLMFGVYRVIVRPLLVWLLSWVWLTIRLFVLVTAQVCLGALRSSDRLTGRVLADSVTHAAHASRYGDG